MKKPKVRLATTEAEALAAHSILRENVKMVGFVTRGAVIQKMLVRRLLIALAPDGAVIGCICFGVRRERTAVIYEIAVSPAEAGNGIGAAMLSWFCAMLIARGVYAIKLKCTVDNAGANKFYERVGFKDCGEERGKRRALKVWRMDLGGGFASNKAG